MSRQGIAAVGGLACLVGGGWVVGSSLAAAAPAASDPAVIRLVRAQPKIVQTACRDARKHVQVRVTCPTLVPATRYIRRTGLWGWLGFSPSVWAVTFNNGDNGPGYVHWIAGGGTMKAIRYYLLGDSVNEVKGLPRLVSRRTVKGYRVAIYEYPAYPAGGPNGGHTAALVQCGSRGVFASIHDDHEPAVTAMALDLARRSCARS